MIKKILASLIILILILFNVSLVLAADPTPTPAPAAPAASSLNPADPTKHKFLLNVPIGKLVDFEIDANAGNNGNDILGKYIQAWYGFLLGTIGIMATVMIMWGGFKYLTSRGDKGVIDTAKTQIISAITGVALAFGTYSILMLINPQLLTITTPNLPGLQGGGNVILEQGSGDTNFNYNNVPSGGITDYGKMTDNAKTQVDLYKEKYGAKPNSGYRSGANDYRHNSGRAMDFHLDTTSNLYKYVTNSQNWSKPPQTLSWGTAYYLNDNSVWVDEPGGTARHFHTEFQDSEWTFCPAWPCK